MPIDTVLAEIAARADRNKRHSTKPKSRRSSRDRGAGRPELSVIA